MKVRAALVAATLVLASVSNAAVVDPAEPPVTPAGGAPEAGIGVAGAVGIAVGIGVIAAIAAGNDDDNGTSATTTTTTTTTTTSQ